MCTVSAVHQYGYGMNPGQWTRPLIDEFNDLVKQAEQFDTAAGEPDCIDPKKAEWLIHVELLVSLKAQKEEIEENIKDVLFKLAELA